MYESVPIVKISEMPSLVTGSADIGAINTKYFPVTPTRSYVKGATVSVGAGDATKTDTITLTTPAEVYFIYVKPSTSDRTNTYKFEVYNSGDALQYTLVDTRQDIGEREFYFKIPGSVGANGYVKLTYTNTAAIATEFDWEVGYLWTETGGIGSVLSTVTTDVGTPLGIVFKGATLYCVDDTGNNVVTVNTTTGAHTDFFSVAAQTTNPRGLTWEGTYFWISPLAASAQIVRRYTAAGVHVDYLDISYVQPLSLSFDGTYCWACYNNTTLVAKLNPADGAVVSTINVAVTDPEAIAHDGTYLWVFDNNDDTIHKINPADGSSLMNFAAPDSNISGMVVYGGYLYCIDSASKNLYKLQM